jgi:hypothetical protein
LTQVVEQTRRVYQIELTEPEMIRQQSTNRSMDGLDAKPAISALHFGQTLRVIVQGHEAAKSLAAYGRR